VYSRLRWHSVFATVPFTNSTLLVLIVPSSKSKYSFNACYSRNNPTVFFQCLVNDDLGYVNEPRTLFQNSFGAEFIVLA
jgi:hypothetical protein